MRRCPSESRCSVAARPPAKFVEPTLVTGAVGVLSGSMTTSGSRARVSASIARSDSSLVTASTATRPAAASPRAQAAGHLQSTAQQTVQVVPGPSPVIQILPAQPELVYVPVYDPLVVYGAWPYPAYRPFYWHPPRFVPPPGVFISFGAGLMVGHALWGHMDWHRRVVRVDVKRYNRYNHAHIVSPNWVHRPEHRRGARYGNPALHERYGRPGGPAAAEALS